MNINEEFDGISASSDHVVVTVEELQAIYNAIVEFIPSHLRIKVGSMKDKEDMEKVIRTMIAVITIIVIQIGGVVDLEKNPLKFGAVQPHTSEEILISITKKSDNDFLSNHLR